jgi:hypothetical protein
VYWRLGEITLTDNWEKLICRVIGEQNAEPKPGHIEVRWDYAPAGESDALVGSGISLSRLGEGKGKEKAKEEGETAEVEEEDPFADDKGPLSPNSIKDSRRWEEVPLVRRLMSGKYESK